jgi:hypothetical protein
MEIMFVLIKIDLCKEATCIYNISTFMFTSVHNLGETDQL